MSANNKKARMLRARMRQNFIDSSQTILDRSFKDYILYVQCTDKYVAPHQTEKLITAAYAKILDRLPHPDNSLQYKVQIKGHYIDALFEGVPLLDISEQPFKNPTYKNRPARQRSPCL